MSKTIGFFAKIASKPFEAIEALLAFALFLSGVWLVSPYYQADVSIAHIATGSNLVAKILGILQIVIGLILFYVLWKVDFPWRKVIRGVVTYTVFLLFLFYAISQMLLYRLHRVTWISTLVMACISGVCHLVIKVKADGQH